MNVKEQKGDLKFDGFYDFKVYYQVGKYFLPK